MMSNAALVLAQPTGKIQPAPGASMVQVVACEVPCAFERCGIWNAADQICGLNMSYGINEMADIAQPAIGGTLEREHKNMNLTAILRVILEELQKKRK